MKLTAMSLVEKVDSFLHAGYISAYPRPLDSYSYPGAGGNEGVEILHQIDVAAALQLGPPASDGAAQANSLAAAIFSGGSTELLVGALTATGVALLLYLYRRQLARHRLRWASTLASVGLVAILASLTNCNESSALPEDKSSALPEDDPWEGVTPKSYIQPEQATLAILHGIITPALANIGQKVEKLANIQDEVALPVAEVTVGESYALQTYGLDGFGNPFQLVSEQKRDRYDENTYWHYEITSAGPDATFGTADDIVAQVDQMINTYWGNNTQAAYFLVKSGGEVNLLYHRWNEEMFAYNDEALAEKMTGSHFFDLIPRDSLENQQLEAIDSAFEAMASETVSLPLVVQVFPNSFSL